MTPFFVQLDGKCKIVDDTVMWGDGNNEGTDDTAPLQPHEMDDEEYECHQLALQEDEVGEGDSFDTTLLSPDKESMKKHVHRPTRHLLQNIDSGSPRSMRPQSFWEHV